MNDIYKGKANFLIKILKLLLFSTLLILGSFCIFKYINIFKWTSVFTKEMINLYPFLTNIYNLKFILLLCLPTLVFTFIQKIPSKDMKVKSIDMVKDYFNRYDFDINIDIKKQVNQVTYFKDKAFLSLSKPNSTKLFHHAIGLHEFRHYYFYMTHSFLIHLKMFLIKTKGCLSIIGTICLISGLLNTNHLLISLSVLCYILGSGHYIVIFIEEFLCSFYSIKILSKQVNFKELVMIIILLFSAYLTYITNTILDVYIWFVFPYFKLLKNTLFMILFICQEANWYKKNQLNVQEKKTSN